MEMNNIFNIIEYIDNTTADIPIRFYIHISINYNVFKLI